MSDEPISNGCALAVLALVAFFVAAIAMGTRIIGEEDAACRARGGLPFRARGADMICLDSAIVKTPTTQKP